MCGRYTLLDLADFVAMFPWVVPPEQFAPRYNIAPSQPILMLEGGGGGTLRHAIWGLIPAWADAEEGAKPLINARSETVAHKPSFRASFKHKRCVIPASGFYEWKSVPGGRLPHYVTLKSGRPMLFAGLWENSHDAAGGEFPTACIITTPASEVMRPIHDRMPAILSPEDAGRWFKHTDASAHELMDLLVPSRQELRLTPVNRLVNSPANDSRECIEPAKSPGELFG